MALCNGLWCIQFPEALMKVLTRLDLSNHYHMLISLYDTDIRRRNPKFKFESAWLLETTYEEIMKRNWKDHLNLKDNLESFKNNIVD